MTRKIIQISNGTHDVVALCNDGTVWEYRGTWNCLPQIPQDRSPEVDEHEMLRQEFNTLKRYHESLTTSLQGILGYDAPLPDLARDLKQAKANAEANALRYAGEAGRFSGSREAARDLVRESLTYISVSPKGMEFHKRLERCVKAWEGE